MDNDKIEKTIEIILENQAQFYTDLQEMKEIQKEAEKRVSVLERISLNLYNTTVEQGKHIAQVSGDIKELREAQKETDERLRETDERLNAVIFMAEKFFSKNNGDSDKK